jgi:outer membrane immunogenic protein
VFVICFIIQGMKKPCYCLGSIWVFAMHCDLAATAFTQAVWSNARLGLVLKFGDKMKKILLAAAVAALSSTSVFAADLAARPYTKAPAYVAPVYNWTGFYVGGFVGGAFGGSNGFSSPTGEVTTGSNNNGAFFGGGQVGANYQFAPNWVVGVEGDIGGLSSSNRTFGDGLAGDSLRDHNDWLASVTGRLGYTWGPGLVYAKGGVAFRDNGGISGTGLLTPVAVDRNDTGYTIGGGLEYMFAPAWSAKIEYQYYNFDKTNVAFAPGFPLTGLSYRDDVHTVKAGINYHFNWGGAVAGRY